MPFYVQNLVYCSGFSLEGDEYSPSRWLRRNGKLNESSKIRFTDISVNFLRTFQNIKLYEDFTL